MEQALVCQGEGGSFHIPRIREVRLFLLTLKE